MYDPALKTYNIDKYKEFVHRPFGGERVNRQRTVGQYRIIDLSLFAVMMMAAEYVIHLAATRWFPAQPYTVSVVPLITAIVMLRWGGWAAIHAVLGGLVLCLVSGAGPKQYAVYCGGNLLALAALPVLNRIGGAERIRSTALATLGYGACILLLMQGGRGLISLLFDSSAAAAVVHITTDVITSLFTLVVLWIARRLDGILENQQHYLRRLHAEQEREKGGVR